MGKQFEGRIVQHVSVITIIEVLYLSLRNKTSYSFYTKFRVTMKHGHLINKLSSFLYIMLLMNLVMLTVKSIYTNYVAFFRCPFREIPFSRSCSACVLFYFFRHKPIGDGLRRNTFTSNVISWDSILKFNENKNKLRVRDLFQVQVKYDFKRISPSLLLKIPHSISKFEMQILGDQISIKA